MSSIQSIIYQVLRKKPILDYLEKRGHQPVKSLPGGKYQFVCPFPDHNETRPSFIVYTQSGDFENFHCYGCQRSYNIIHLVAGLEGLSFKEALARLSEGMEISLSDGVDIELERIAKDFERPREVVQLQDVLMAISSMARSYLESVNNDPAECCIIDSLYASVDNDIASCCFENIYETFSFLSATLMKRRRLLKKTQLERVREECKSQIKGSNETK